MHSNTIEIKNFWVDIGQVKGVGIKMWTCNICKVGVARFWTHLGGEVGGSIFGKFFCGRHKYIAPLKEYKMGISFLHPCCY